jgi:PAS domain S-box-containing protein
MAEDSSPGDLVPVLLVDDDPVALRHLDGILARPGWELVPASSADHALGLLARRDFAAVLLDLDMPGTNGFDTAKLARAQPRSRGTPIIFVTAHSYAFPVAEAYRLGAVDYLTKPLVPDIIRAKVEVFADLFRKSRRLLELEREGRDRAEAELRAVEGRLQLMVESATDFAIFSTDPGGLVTYWNAGAERLFGWAEADILGTPCDVLFTPEDRAAGQPERERREAAGTGRAEDERWHVRKDGTRFWASGVVTPLRDGPLGGFAKVARDLTARKLAEDAVRASEARLRAILDATPECIKVLAPDGALLDINPSGLRMVGADDPSSVVGRSIYRVITPEYREAFREFNERVCRGESGILEFDILGAGGSRRHMETSAVPLDDGGRVVQLAVSRDVTARKLAELEARRLLEALREGDKRKDEFLATLAHELRNPLAPIRNALALLRQAGDRKDVAEKAVGVMDRQVGHMVRLIDDLLDVSRVSQGKITLRRQKADLRDAVRQAVETSGPAVERGRHSLSVSMPDAPVWVDADPTRVAQAVSNVLNNAAKYTPPGGRIGVSTGVEGEQAVVRVSDSGVGIPPDMLPRVFDLFTQVDRSLHRSQGGLGIGLSLVRSLVELHGGSVEAHSEGVGKGSEFVLRLPLMGNDTRPERRGAAPTPSVITPPPPRGLDVLLVEDNRDAAETLQAVLELDGHRVTLAHDGPSGVDAARQLRPDVVVCDIGLPGLDGYRVARELRSDPATAPALLISVSGYGQDEDRRKAREAGFDYTLVKPVSSDILLRLLASWAGHAPES